MIEFIKKILKASPISLTKNARYDRQTNKIIKRLSPGSNCIDVGCFKGEILDLMIAVAPEGRHFGIEPIPKQYNFLSKKYKNVKNVSILNYAASNVSGNATFNYVISNPSYSGLIKRDYDKPNEQDTTIEVKTELLDHLIPPGLRIDLIKIDVEGAELQVLEGAAKLITEYRPIVIFEHGLGAADHYGTTPDKIFRFFTDKSMKVSTMTSYLRKKKCLGPEEFEKHFYERKNYYFIAYKE